LRGEPRFFTLGLIMAVAMSYPAFGDSIRNIIGAGRDK
jgi:hypothetical protein